MKQHPREKPRPRSADDLADAELLAACKKAAVNSLKPILAVNPDRYLRQLQDNELTAMVVAVMAEYISVRRLLEVRAELNDDISDVGVA